VEIIRNSLWLYFCSALKSGKRERSTVGIGVNNWEIIDMVNTISFDGIDNDSIALWITSFLIMVSMSLVILTVSANWNGNHVDSDALWVVVIWMVWGLCALFIPMTRVEFDLINREVTIVKKILNWHFTNNKLPFAEICTFELVNISSESGEMYSIKLRPTNMPSVRFGNFKTKPKVCEQIRVLNKWVFGSKFNSVAILNN